MVDVRLRAEAKSDMREIYLRGIAEFGIDAADEYIDGIGEAYERLAQFPQSGPIFPGIRPPVRYLAYKRHRIIYDYDGDSVEIVRVVHQAMDLKRLI